MSSLVVSSSSWKAMPMVAADSLRFSGSFLGASFSRRSSDVSAGSLVRRKPWRCACGIRGSREMALKDSTERDFEGTRMRAVLTPGTGAELEAEHSMSFLKAGNEEELLSYIRKKVESGHLSSDIGSRLEELYYNYKKAVLQSGDPSASEVVLSNMAVAFELIQLDVEDPFIFEPYHKAIREPFDYYMFGQNYFRPLIDFRRSYIGNISLFLDMELKLQQTEADAQLIALLLERTSSLLAEKMVFLAGERVIKDPLAKPFCMGRNLLCVYSKKHMDDAPELVEMKRTSNSHCLKKLASLLRSGSQIVWIAPSGGRDRPDPLTGEWYPDLFDAYSMDNIRRVLDHSGAQGHIYPLALLCYEVLPPPPEVEKQIGERRNIFFHGIGLSVAPEMKFNEITVDCRNFEEARKVFSLALYDSVVEQYNVLNLAIHGRQGLSASNSIISLSQPWL